MKRLSGTLGIGLALVWGLLILVTGIPQVQAQTDPNGSAASLRVYLPLITQAERPPRVTLKNQSGIHLGNRDSSDWWNDLFTNISTRTVTGIWPAAVTVMSDQLYTVHRYTSGECRIVGVTLKLTGDGKLYNVYQYLTEAVRAGTKVVIRITPSPGNFIDYAQPGSQPHTLLATSQPAGKDYCDDPNKPNLYRDIQDIAEEMKAIYDVNTQHQWPPTSFFFEPANEPNYEWYGKFREKGIIVKPPVSDKLAWSEMDDYFAALYDKAKSPQFQPQLQILSPSFSQSLYGEHYKLGSCYKWQVDGDGKHRSGIDFMKKTFGYDQDAGVQFSAPKADGFAWHNYWRAGQEAWKEVGQLPSIDIPCAGKPLTDTETVITSDHVIQYLSAEVLAQIGPRPNFITEADIKSPCQENETGAAKSKDYDAQAISDSLVRFINEERYAGYVIAWLLVNQNQDKAQTCRTGKNLNQNYENNWHEAYSEDANGVYERNWFRLWWPVAW